MTPEELKAKMDAFRTAIAGLVAEAAEIKAAIGATSPGMHFDLGEMMANTTLGIRHLEDAAMRFGKTIQASAGGVSPLGGPKTPVAGT